MPDTYRNAPELDDAASDELAEMTDRLLVGQEAEVSAGIRDDAQVVRMLHQMFSSDPPPSATYRAQLTRRLNEEWDQISHRRSNRFFVRPAQRAAALAAAILVVLGVVLLGSLTSARNGNGIAGTAVGPLNATLPVFIVAGIIVLALALWSRRH